MVVDLDGYRDDRLISGCVIIPLARAHIEKSAHSVALEIRHDDFLLG